ncbi:MAG: sugar ABC transporter permease [Eubacteriales bacterium]|nr:sugar ABC transporter permease [Eubacteriales bacterium]
MKKAKRNKYRVFWPTFFLAPFFVCFFLFNLFPVLYSFYMSTLDWNGYGEKVTVGFQNYVDVFTKDAFFWSSLWNTIKIGIIGFPIAIILGLIFAALLCNLKCFKNLLQTVNFLPYITTPVAIGMIFTFIFEKHIGFLNRLIMALGGEAIDFIGSPTWAPFVIAFMIIWKCTGYYMTMYLAGITSISEDVYEAATIDGANRIQTFFKITIPLLKPVTIFVAITSAIYAFQLFDEPNLVFSNQSSSSVGGPGQSCLTMVWNFYNQAFGANPRLGYASALSCVLFIFIVIVSLVGLRMMNGKED